MLLRGQYNGTVQTPLRKVRPPLKGGVQEPCPEIRRGEVPAKQTMPGGLDVTFQIFQETKYNIGYAAGGGLKIQVLSEPLPPIRGGHTGYSPVKFYNYLAISGIHL
jgi:hypothetical protein